VLIDPKSHIPVYRQIVDQVCRAIESGVYKPGEALPSQRALAAEVRVNPNTVQRAFDELVRDGVVESKRGLGVFVVGRTQTLPKGSGERETAKALKQGIQRGLAANLAPTRIRQLFETEMRRQVSPARGKP
jgi:GntR family transcriptional regulator